MTVEALKAHLERGGQILKTRDDHEPVLLDRKTGTPDSGPFTLPADSKCTWAKPEETFGLEKLRPRIEP